MREHQRQWKLEEIRELNNDTQEELARFLNINPTTYEEQKRWMQNLRPAKCFLLPRGTTKK